MLYRLLKWLLLAVVLFTAVRCRGGNDRARPTPTADPRPLPFQVEIRPEPQGVTLADPSFEPLVRARADFGRLGGTVYQIEVPDNWNHKLVLFMHGYAELRPQAAASPPEIRGYLIGHGYAWGASSFSSTSQIPGRAADETAALWDYFEGKYGRPDRTYITGKSMGGAATNIAAERYGDRFDGALALCGSAGLTEGTLGQADFFAAGAYFAGVTQAEFDASTDLGRLIQERILPALKDPLAHKRFEDIMLDLTGGPRSFDRQGFELEEDTNWQRAQILVTSRLAPNKDTVYRLGPLSTVASDDFNRGVIRLPVNHDLMRNFVAGNDATGGLAIPLLTVHSTGDGQVPIGQARILQRRVDAAGKSDLLVERVIGDPGHRGFTDAEWEAGREALVAWVEQREARRRRRAGW